MMNTVHRTSLPAQIICCLFGESNVSVDVFHPIECRIYGLAIGESAEVAMGIDREINR